VEDIVRLKRITTWTSSLLVICIAFIIPTVYLFSAYQYQSVWLKTEVNIAADDISEVIYSHPGTWAFQIYRMEEILERKERNNLLSYSINQNDGKVLLTIGEIDTLFSESLSEALYDGSENVAEITVIHDMRPLIIRVIFVFAFGLVIAGLVYMVLRLLPFAALNRVTQSLIESRQALDVEVKAKELALREQKQISERMRFQSLHDPLTKLPNRKYFYEHLNEYIIEGMSASKNAWVVIIDLDRFKEINDALGHHSGDIVLKEVSSRLMFIMSEGSLIARLGGDEFAFFIINKSRSELEMLLTKVRRSLKAHIKIQDIHLAVYVSIGVAKYPEHGRTYEVLLKHADLAMYHGKSTGEDWVYYDQGFSESTIDKLNLVSDLRDALDTKKLAMYFQPKVSLDTGNVIGFESLARWHHNEFGHISPDTFIPIAEQTNMIHELTRWAIDESLIHLEQLQKNYNSEFTISVNISAKNLQNVNFVKDVQRSLQSYDVSPEQLILEITETSVMHDPEQSQLIVKKLAVLGVKISIDDFGTGYSSLAYLKKLEVHEVKIDRSFIFNLLTDHDDLVIVESTIKLVQSLGLAVVAEGVENKETAEILKNLKCEYAQGYYYCKALNLSELNAWLKKHT